MDSIVVYSKANCGQCTLTKKHLQRLDANFSEVDVLEDKVALDLIKSKGYKSLPVVNKGDIWFSGFQPEKLEELV